MRTLKPCPKCNHFSIEEDDYPATATTFFVVCEKCSFEGPLAKSFEEAGQLWNYLPREFRL